MTGTTALSQAEALTEATKHLEEARASLRKLSTDRDIWKHQFLDMAVMFRKLWLYAERQAKVVHRVKKHQPRRFDRCTDGACHEIRTAWDKLPVLMQAKETLEAQDRWPG